ncbi:MULTISPECIES: DedA family protein [unclassified Francisella]|uniref:DedA family protein n=1 Tax=unclassified Francisella TaxID=2610885 RepID=UPI002E35D3D3|nr:MULTISPECIES: DedA family protein [unclassified Francisella]MED7818705.1 DedA family protein [Francisella sp. 19S2-4]MED7829578.1 DedA family protein [Francisella sp. 19S2-10]
MSEQEFWSLLVNWGYLAVALAVFVEGEIFLIMVGIATAATLFSYPLVIIAATLGAIAHDNTIFILSKFIGKKLILRKASWSYKARKASKLLEKYESLAILSIRFLYGLRTITILIVGLSRVSKYKFISLDALSSFIWSFIYITLGYLFGHAILKFINHFDISNWISNNKYLSIFILILLSSIIYLSYRILRSRSKRRIR